MGYFFLFGVQNSLRPHCGQGSVRPHQPGSLLFLLLSLLFAANVSAQEPSLNGPPVEKEVDAILLLDASASMRLTDPKRLRDEGAKLFTQFLKSGDRLGIIEFDSEARVLRPLSKYHPMQAPEVDKAIESASDEGIYTDPVGGILKAKKMFEQSHRDDAIRTIILLSDGKLDPDPKWATPEGLRDGLLYRLLPELKKEGVVLHTVALSEQADRELLAEMAHVTGGTSLYSETAEGIHEAFTSLFLTVKKPQIVPLTSKGFRIDGEVEQATFYINTEGKANIELSLKTPAGNIYEADDIGSGIEWFVGENFQVVTVDDPEPGRWQVLGLGNNKGFATVLTALKLITDWPSSLLAGNKRVLRARLYDREKPVVLPEMTNVTTYAFQITPTDLVSEPIIRDFLTDDGEGVDTRADDGVFSANVELETPGDYQLKLLAKGPTFERQQTIPFRVKPRLINLSVVPVEREADVTMGQMKGTTIDYFRVTMNPEVSGLKNIEVKLIAIDEKRQLFELPIQNRAEGSLRYEVSSSSLVNEGEYELQATISGESRSRKVRGTSQLILYTKKKTEIDTAEHVTRVVVEKEEENPEPPYVFFSLLILFANAGTAAFCFLQLKKHSGPSEDKLPDFTIDPTVLESLATLEELAEATEVDLDNPRYTGDDDIELPASGLGGEGSGEPETGEAQEAEEAAEPESGEALEESGDASDDSGEEADVPSSDSDDDESAEESLEKEEEKTE